MTNFVSSSIKRFPGTISWLIIGTRRGGWLSATAAQCGASGTGSVRSKWESWTRSASALTIGHYISRCGAQTEMNTEQIDDRDIECSLFSVTLGWGGWPVCHLPHLPRSNQGHTAEVHQRHQDPQESLCQVDKNVCNLEKFRENVAQYTN